jgi:hypothetical protein
VVRVAHTREGQLPVQLRFIRETLRFARDTDDLAARLANLLHHTRLCIASQLEATRRSPESSVEHEPQESVTRELLLEPTLPNVRRRI